LEVSLDAALSTGRPKTSPLRASQTLTKREVRELATPVLNDGSKQSHAAIANGKLPPSVQPDLMANANPM
jgi:hypothetical protein